MIFEHCKGGVPDFLHMAGGIPMEDYMPYDYENGEEHTDEARTNEEAYEELQQ
jgi:hypothetical protein